jgi:basic membrane protein A
MKKLTFLTITILLGLSVILSACGQTPTPAAPAEQPTTPPVPPTVAPTEVKPCLIIGALYGGSMNDAGYNQAFHEGVTAIKKSIPCVRVIEAENVQDPDATRVMQDMIQQGAKLIFPTAYGEQQPAFDLAKTNKDVRFEHAGGWMMSDNFANFFGNPPDTWYVMGVAAGLMTKSNKLGFVASMPGGWTLTFINAFELGAQSVNPKAQTIVNFTFNWVDHAKEAAAVDALIGQGVDVVTMHVDAPGTVIQTAEAKGVYSIGFQNLAAQQFAPQYWITGTGYTLGGKMTWLAQSVIDKTWQPIFLRCGVADGCMAIAPFGPKVPQTVKDKVNAVLADVNAKKIIVFAGPIVDQDGKVRVEKGKTLSDNDMGNVDWFVKGVIGKPK